MNRSMYDPKPNDVAGRSFIELKAGNLKVAVQSSVTINEDLL